MDQKVHILLLGFFFLGLGVNEMFRFHWKYILQQEMPFTMCEKCC